MRKISRRMTCCYYPSWKHSDSTIVHYALLVQLDVFRLYGGGGVGVGVGRRRRRRRRRRLTPSSSNVIVPLCRAVPRTAPDTPTPLSDHLVLLGP